jgi:putative Mg2+ transporter-C (MgtC) family protein
MDLLFDNWRLHWPGPWTYVLLALVSVLAGAIIGAERERHEKPAGLRTLMLVSFGSALFTMVSFVFTSTTGDSGRVAAQVVTGIGFLGAGVIMHGPGLVTGTNTAATIWLTAAIGMAAGAGYPAAALGASLVARGVLSGVRVLETAALRRAGLVRLVATFEPDRGKTRAHLQRVLSEFNVPPDSVRWLEAEGQLALDLFMHGRALSELADELARLPGVTALSREDLGRVPPPVT